jgi:hypothetical protein
MRYQLTVNIRRQRGCAIVTPAGELDLATAPQLHEFLLALLPAHPALVINLDQVSFCDAPGSACWSAPPTGRTPTGRACTWSAPARTSGGCSS